MDVVLHGLLEHEREVARLGAVAVVVRPLVIDLGHRHVEHALGPVDLLRNLRQIGDLQRRSVLLMSSMSGMSWKFSSLSSTENSSCGKSNDCSIRSMYLSFMARLLGI